MKSLGKIEIEKVIQQLKIGQSMRLALWQLIDRSKYEYFIGEMRIGKHARAAYQSTVETFRRKRK